MEAFTSMRTYLTYPKLNSTEKKRLLETRQDTYKWKNINTEHRQTKLFSSYQNLQ